MSNVLLTMTSIFSIHAPRMGSDCIRPVCIHQNAFSIHAPRMGSYAGKDFRYYKVFDFQFTLPVWGATHPILFCMICFFFNSRSPQGERPLFKNG